MNEMSYQVSQLEAMNNRLQNDETMFKMICETSPDAFVYLDFVQRRIVHLGNWSHFFDFELNYNAISRLLDVVEEKYHTDVYDCLMLEKNKLSQKCVEFKVIGKSMWIQMDAYASYDESKKEISKLLRFKDIPNLRNRMKRLISLHTMICIRA